MTSTFANNAVRASASCLAPPASCLLPPHSSPRHVPPRSIIRQMSEQAGRRQEQEGEGRRQELEQERSQEQAGDTRLLQLRLLVALAATSANEISRHVKAFVSLMRRKAMSGRSARGGGGRGRSTR